MQWPARGDIAATENALQRCEGSSLEMRAECPNPPMQANARSRTSWRWEVQPRLLANSQRGAHADSGAGPRPASRPGQHKKAADCRTQPQRNIPSR